MWKTVLLLCCLRAASAIITFRNLEEKPENFKDQPGCYVADLKELIPVGSSSKLRDPCMQYVCQEQHLVIETCPEITKEVDPEHIKVVNTDVYPDCCPRITSGFLKKHDEF